MSRSRLLAAALIACALATLAFGDVRRLAYDTEIKDVYFEEDRIDSVLKALWAIVEGKHRDTPSLQIDYPKPEYGEKVISLRIRESNVYRAFELAGRKAGFRVTISPHALILSPGPDRQRSKAILSEQLALRNLLVRAVTDSDASALDDLELKTFAEKQILETRVFRAGTNARGEIPIEFYALSAIASTHPSSDEISQLFEKASITGKLYLTAFFPLDSKILRTTSPPSIVPYLPDQGVLFQTAPTKSLIEEYIDSGNLKQRIEELLPPSVNSAKP
ncbi:MAG: hypothetical protein ACPGN3_05495 [Opitutales bacterium]